MNAIAPRSELQEVARPDAGPTDAGALMEVISKAASDPAVDVDKLERLMGLYERVQDRGAKAEFTSALASLQPALPVIDENGAIKNTKGEVQSTYAKWEDINDVIKPILHDRGFALSFRPGRVGDQVTVTGVLSHIGGHSEEATVTLGLDGSGSKNNVQAVGSSLSYAKRYAAISLLNITSRHRVDADDDGGSADDNAAVSAAYASIDMCMSPVDCAEWKRKNLAELDNLPSGDRAKIVSYFNARSRKVKTEALNDFPGDRP